MLRWGSRARRARMGPVRRLAYTGTAAAVLAAALPALSPVPVAQAAAAEPGARLSEGQEALAEAKKSGERVEVVGERSERATVFANPDGFTFTLEQSMVPVRVAKPGGAGGRRMRRWCGVRTVRWDRGPLRRR